MIRKILATSLLLFAVAFAESDAPAGNVDNTKSSRVEKLESALAKIINKAGIHIGGEFRSQFLYSTVESGASGQNITTLTDSTKRSDEGVEYTSLDLNITARPHSAASGTLILRLHQDWRNFFGALKSPVSARWISMDGVVADMFRYNVGSFTQKYSPLFMWSPDVNIDFEPEIFAKYRRMAMNEDFIGNNDRFMEGINLNLDAEVDPIFKEWHLNLMGARLRSSGVRPEVGGNSVIQMSEASMFDRYVFGFNTDHVIIPDVEIGATFMDIWDDENTYSGGSLTDTNTLKILADQQFVVGGRLKLGTANFIDPKKINVNLNGEFATSINDSEYIAIVNDSTSKFTQENVVGIALRGGLDFSAGITGAKGKVSLSADFIYNEEDYKNEMAQSPTFIGNSRVMNVENDHADGNLYSTFDALYRHVFKFTPSRYLAEAKNGFYKVPVRKISYTSAVLTHEEMDTIGAGDSVSIYDPSFNIVMPNGPATANRMGADIDLNLELLEKAILVKGDFSVFSTLDSTILDVSDSTYNTQTFIEFGGGASIDVGKLGDWWKYPVILSGGYMHSIKNNDVVKESMPGWEQVTSQFVNAGLYFTFWKRASLLGGVQVLNSNFNIEETNNGNKIITRDNFFKQMHWAAGLEWKVSENGTLTASFGQTYLQHKDWDTNALGYTLQKAHYNQTDLYLTVNF